MCVPSPPSLGARLHPPRPLVLLHAACGGVARAAGARAAVALRAAALPARARAVPRAVGRDAGRGESASGGGLIAHWLETSQGSRRGLSGPAPGQSERLTLSVGLGYTPRRREVARNAGLACMSWATYDQHAQHFGLVHGGGTSYAACTAGGVVAHPYAERFFSGTDLDSSPLGAAVATLFPVGYPELLPLFIAAAVWVSSRVASWGGSWAEALRRTMCCRTRCCKCARRLGLPLRRTRPAATGSRRSARGGRGATRASRAACTALPARRCAA